MEENPPKSKLKRRKTSVEKPQAETGSRDRERSRDITEESRGSVNPAAAWWSREELPAVESLWAITLKSALPYLQDQHWHLVPDLPHPSIRPAAQQLGEQWWCDLREEVAPLPEPGPPSPRTLSSPDPLGLCSPQQDVSVHTKPAVHTSDTQFSSHSSHAGRTAPPRALAKRQWSSLHNREEAASSAGCSSVRAEEGRKGGEQDEAVGPVKRLLLTKQVKERGNEEEVVMDKEKEEVLGRARGDEGAAAAGGGGRLQCCPMCLLVFPVGFTQMDCDGHLAQCLSELNVDMTW
ncbi:uncharacterized protein si:ch73-70k4.1 [Paralichthys olivaceus]|uniref:uncharacterized protein si:ch73-70k4.1 n=1 Tax=Paralichthys olivaceus TaxID=8255 RepID=UPI0037500771